MTNSRVGICFPDRPDFDTLLPAAKRADELGYESIVVFETRLARDAISVLGAIASHTKNVKIGPGVVNSWTRGPALMAMSFATLDEMAPGRTFLGIGAYWEPLASKQGLNRRQPVTQLREYVEVFRKLLTLERVSFDGEVVTVDDISLDLAYGRPRVPIKCPVLIGATGPKMTESAASYADGILLNFLISPDYTKAAVDRINEFAIKAGRDPSELDNPQIIATAMDDDGDKARDIARRMLTMYLGQQPHIGKASGLSDDYLAALHDAMGGWPAKEGGIEAAMKLVDDETLTNFVAAGTPDECLRLARRYVDAGASYPIPVVLTPQTTMDIVEAFAQF